MSSFSQHHNSDFLKYMRPTFNKHLIIQRYKDSQRQKSILKNKLNILQQQCQRNLRKTKSIQTSLKRVNKIKESYRRDNVSIQQLLRKNNAKQMQKIDKVRIRKQESRDNLPLIKYWLEKQKTQDYQLVKKNSKKIEEKIRVFKNSVISERKKAAQKIKQQEQMIAYNRTLYFQSKQKNVKIQQQEETSRIERKLKRSRLELQEMKTLEDSLLYKIDRSRATLNKSMNKMSKSIRG